MSYPVSIVRIPAVCTAMIDLFNFRQSAGYGPVVKVESNLARNSRFRLFVTHVDFSAVGWGWLVLLSFSSTNAVPWSQAFVNGAFRPTETSICQAGARVGIS